MRVRFYEGHAATTPPESGPELLIGIAYDEEPGVDRGQMREVVRPATAEDAALYGNEYQAYADQGGKLEPPPAPDQQPAAEDAQRAGREGRQQERQEGREQRQEGRETRQEERHTESGEHAPARPPQPQPATPRR